MSLFSDYDFALFTFKSTSQAGRWGEWTTSRDVINSDYPDYSARTCLVGTMVDLVPPDSAQYIALQCLPSTVAYFSRLKFISASSVTGTGIQTIASYISEWCGFCLTHLASNRRSSQWISCSLLLCLARRGLCSLIDSATVSWTAWHHSFLCLSHLMSTRTYVFIQYLTCFLIMFLGS